MGIIKYRTDASSPWVDVPALKGDKGDKGDAGYTPVKGVDYFTEEEIAEIEANAAAKVEIPEVDLSGYALVEHEHSQYLTEHQSLEGYALKSDVPSIEGLASEEYVAAQIGAIDIPETDLSGYATTEYVDNAVDGIEIPEVDLSGYALKSDIPTVPTKVSAFANDAGYLTEHQSLSAYATTASVTEALKGKSDTAHSHSEYATTLYVDNAVAAVPRYDLTAYATKTYVDNAIDELPKYDMAAYALKTEIPDVSNYATKLYVQTEIAKIETGEVDLSEYAKKSEIPDVSEYQTASQVQALIDASLGVIENGTY